MTPLYKVIKDDNIFVEPKILFNGSLVNYYYLVIWSYKSYVK